MTISSVTLRGYKTFDEVQDFKLRKINVFIGANGSGKSNFMSVFRLLANSMAGNLQEYVQKVGGPDALLHRTRSKTESFAVKIVFPKGIADGKEIYNTYTACFAPTEDNRLLYKYEVAGFIGTFGNTERPVGLGHSESKLKTHDRTISKYVYNAMLSWREYHFHDTSDTSKIKRLHGSNDNLRLKPTGENLAAYLAMLEKQFPDSYAEIVSTIQLTAPFFGGFVIRDPLPENIELEWYSREDPDTPNKAHLLSDGTLRFICLTTLLLQPYYLQQATILIDEPELGLHPHAILLLAVMIKRAAKNKQVIISTQSCELLNAFAPEDVVIVEREGSTTKLKRLSEEDLKGWLEEYSLADLWKSNVLGGRPT